MARKEGYGYAVARLWALENRLIDNSVFQRMIDSDSIESALKVLGETQYSNAVMELKSPLEFDKAIEKTLKACYDEAESFVPDADLIGLLRLVYDVHNVKAIVKSQILVREGEKSRYDLLTKLGNIDTDKLVLAIEGEEYSELPYGLSEGVSEAVASWDQNHNLLSVEKILDGVYFKALLQLAEKLNMPQVTNWVRCRIDGENIKTMLRLAGLNFDKLAVASFLHEGGAVSTEKLAALIFEPVENWSKILSSEPIATLLESFTEDCNFAEQLVQYEKNLDDFLTASISESRYGSFEPANVARYLWMREIEAKNLRVVLVSVSNGVDKDTIRGLLRDVRSSRS